MASIGVIDYGMGNLHSAQKALEHAAPGARVFLSDNHADLAAADRLVLPGVGSIGHCMHALTTRGLDEVVREAFGQKPLLGICVGMQLLFERGEENRGIDTLGLLPGQVCRLPDEPQLTVPHMGWNQVAQTPHPLWNGIPDQSRFYFVHSYYRRPADDDYVVGTARHGVELTAAVAAPQLFAVQFHPEKSHASGLKLLQNFAAWDGADG